VKVSICAVEQALFQSTPQLLAKFTTSELKTPAKA